MDDHEVVRQGLRFVLEQEGDIRVVGECTDGGTAVPAIRALDPDVVLLDMRMPGLDGLGVLRALKTGGNRPAIIILTSFPADDRALEAVRAGALSYLPKTAATERVVEAVRAAAVGDSFLDPSVTAVLVNRVRNEPDTGPLRVLSPREREVLSQLARGRSNKEIARAFTLSEETVKSHVSNILTKLGLQDRTQAAIFGLQQGLVSLNDALTTESQEK
ncbi:response regulator transcription factor [Dactylosporangium sp. NPDC050688]|uniref:response regulator transcription factor n=1 Tax=Dactylosporangium sp. NPDC050688 TaxID=3157217 RepID=UPI00340F7D9C